MSIAPNGGSRSRAPLFGSFAIRPKYDGNRTLDHANYVLAVATAYGKIHQAEVTVDT